MIRGEVERPFVRVLGLLAYDEYLELNVMACALAPVSRARLSLRPGLGHYLPREGFGVFGEREVGPSTVIQAAGTVSGQINHSASPQILRTHKRQPEGEGERTAARPQLWQTNRRRHSSSPKR